MSLFFIYSQSEFDFIIQDVFQIFYNKIKRKKIFRKKLIIFHGWGAGGGGPRAMENSTDIIFFFNDPFPKRNKESTEMGL